MLDQKIANRSGHSQWSCLLVNVELLRPPRKQFKLFGPFYNSALQHLASQRATAEDRYSIEYDSCLVLLFIFCVSFSFFALIVVSISPRGCGEVVADFDVCIKALFGCCAWNHDESEAAT